MFYTYILYSKSLDKYYKGHTKDLDSRLKRHNNGESKYTSSGMPWQLVMSIPKPKPKPTRKAAAILERKLKNLNRDRLETFVVKYKTKKY
ncbi:MAG: GIY-YIG nuclease family protein [Psychroserpens sp.]|uniref:GIY-YIG nuclease family protein n=1 Tax=Psychroserpens sp. TaxID=2020870 RepID=UPI003C8EA7EB